MKIKDIYRLCLLLALVSLASCGSDDDSDGSGEDANTAKLAHEWTVGSEGEVRRDNNDVTSKYSDFSILFSTSNSYIVQNDPDNVIYPSGTWQFNGDNSSQIILNSDERPVSVEYTDNNQTLTLTFNITEDLPLGSRVSGVSGEYIFRLKRSN